MRSRCAFVGVFVVLLMLSCADWVEPATDVDPGGCPTPETWALPGNALTADAALAVDVPLIPGPSTLECPDVNDCGVHFQEIFVEPLPVGAANLTSLSFRLDESTPLETLAGDLCWSVQVELGSYPYDVEDVSSTFEMNIVDPVQVYDGPVCLLGAESGEIDALGEELQIVFAEPYPYDPVAGNLVVEVTIDSLVGTDQGFFLDAADGNTAISVVALNGDDALFGQFVDGGPIVILDGIPGEVLPGLPWDCIAGLNAPSYVVDRLGRYLDRAEWASVHGRPWLVQASIRSFYRAVDRYERRGVISAEVAERAQDLGGEAAGAYFSPSVVANGLNTHSQASLFMTLFFLPDFVGPKLPEGSRAEGALEDLENAVDEILTDGVFDESDAAAADNWVEALGGLIRHGWRYLVGDTRTLMRELWEWWRGLQEILDDPLFRLYIDFWRILSDNQITADEADELIELARRVQELTEGEPGTDYQRLIDEMARMVGDLATHLKSGAIVKIVVVPWGDGTWYIHIDTSSGFYLKLFDETTPDHAGGYTLSPWIWIDDLHLRWTPGDDGHEIEVIGVPGPDGFKYTCQLNLDSDGWFVVWYLSSLFGLDLDEVTITGVTYNSNGLVITGWDDSGQPVVVEVKNGTITVSVNGKQTYPE